MGAIAASFAGRAAPIVGPPPPPPPGPLPPAPPPPPPPPLPPPPPPPPTGPLPSRPPVLTGAQLQEGLARSAGRWVHNYVLRGVPSPEEFWDRFEAEQDALN